MYVKQSTIRLQHSGLWTVLQILLGITHTFYSTASSSSPNDCEL